MRIHSVPASLRSPGHRYPPHNRGEGLEGCFDAYAREHAAELDTDWIYLPVRWTNNYVADRNQRKVSDLCALSRHQDILDCLHPDERYFTVVQCDDGIYEQVPNNMLVFGAGGTGDIPIPLLCDRHVRRHLPRKLLASFSGQLQCGGPAAGVKGRSSWDPQRGGGPIRRAMRHVFECHGDCYLSSPGGSTEFFRDLCAQTVFGLAPRGYGKSSFRLYEVMDLGCIPVYLYSKPWLPYSDVLDWKSFCVLCAPEQIPDLYDRLAAVTHRDAMLTVVSAVYEEYFTMNGMCRQIFRMIKERT